MIKGKDERKAKWWKRFFFGKGRKILISVGGAKLKGQIRVRWSFSPASFFMTHRLLCTNGGLSIKEKEKKIETGRSSVIWTAVPVAPLMFIIVMLR